MRKFEIAEESKNKEIIMDSILTELKRGSIYIV